MHDVGYCYRFRCRPCCGCLLRWQRARVMHDLRLWQFNWIHFMPFFTHPRCEECDIEFYLNGQHIKYALTDYVKRSNFITTRIAYVSILIFSFASLTIAYTIPFHIADASNGPPNANDLLHVMGNAIFDFKYAPTKQFSLDESQECDLVAIKVSY